jgi:hypothetical protein
MNSDFVFKLKSFEIETEAILFRFSGYPISKNVHLDDNIIRLVCGHFVPNKMIETLLTPKFNYNCLDPYELYEHSCDYCESTCMFVCSVCNNFISELATIKTIQYMGLTSWIMAGISTEEFNIKIERKRKHESDHTEYFNKMTCF